MRELETALGVYTNVFEQSLILNPHPHKPWNFLASLSAELLIVSLVVLIPLAYSEHLQVFHWKDITVGPPPSAPPVQQAAAHPSGPTNAKPSPLHRTFYLDRAASLHPPQPTSIEFASDAPPVLAGNGVGGSTAMLGTFIPNMIAAPPPPTPPVDARKEPSAPIPVGGDVQMAKLLRKVIPEYPQLARSARISGVVRLIGTIGKDGAIRNLQIVSGHPMLTRAAMEAVEQWLYKPTLLNGKPVEVIAPIEVSFTLEH